MPAQSPGDPYAGQAKGGRATAAKKTPEQHQAAMADLRGRRTLPQQLLVAADPDGTLAQTNPAELERSVAELRRQHFAALGRASHEARRARRLAYEAAQIAAEAVLRAQTKVGAA